MVGSKFRGRCVFLLCWFSFLWDPESPPVPQGHCCIERRGPCNKKKPSVSLTGGCVACYGGQVLAMVIPSPTVWRRGLKSMWPWTACLGGAHHCRGLASPAAKAAQSISHPKSLLLKIETVQSSRISTHRNRFRLFGYRREGKPSPGPHSKTRHTAHEGGPGPGPTPPPS